MRAPTVYSHQLCSNVKTTITITTATAAATATTTTTTATTNNVCSQVRMHRYKLLVYSVNNKKDKKSTTRNNDING